MRILHRTDPIARVGTRIERLREEATTLLEREREMQASVEAMRDAAGEQGGFVRRKRRRRALARAERKLEELRTNRINMSDAELRAIMLELQLHSHNTRERLDEALERLAPLEAEWDRLRSTFDALAATITLPALEPVAGQVPGELEIPEFPVRRSEDYAKPFPEQAVVF